MSLQAVCNLQPIVYRLSFLDGKTKAIVLDPSETASDALCRVAEKIGLQSTYGWALYEVLTAASSQSASTSGGCEACLTVELGVL